MIKKENATILIPGMCEDAFGNLTNFATLHTIEAKYRNGVPLPNHASLIANKLNATTPLIASTESLHLIDGHARFRSTINASQPRTVLSTWLGVEPNIPAAGSFPVSLSNKAVADSRSKAFDKIRAKQTPFQGQAFLGELHQTIQLLKNPLGSFVKLTNGLLAKKSRKLVSKDISNLWLEYRFGILPLISDVNSILKIAKDLIEKDEVLSYRVYSQSTSSTSSSISSGVGTLAAIMTGTTDNIYKSECIIRFGLLNSALDKNLDLSSKVQASLLRIEDVPVTAWELIPYSFLVDYFVNVGDIIQAATTGTSGISYTSESVIETEIYSVSSSSVTPVENYLQLLSYTPRVITFQRRVVKRNGESLAIPPITFSLPGSNIKYLNIAALLASR